MRRFGPINENMEKSKRRPRSRGRYKNHITDPGLLKVIGAVKGDIQKLARKISYSPQAIYLWKRVPAELVVKVEEATGVPRQQIRPELY